MQTPEGGSGTGRLSSNRDLILELLAEHRLMAVSTLRPDGWPQNTMVGYVHDGLTIYFAVARTSQKLANITRDSRVSLALGHRTELRLRGLSIAGRAYEIIEPAAVEHLNRLMRDKYPGESPLAPRERSTAVLRVTPEVISVIEALRDSGRPPVFHVRDGELVDEAGPSSWPSPSGKHDPLASFYRPGAPL